MDAQTKQTETVALVLPNLERGGAQRQALELAHGLRERGWRVALLVAEMHGPLADEAAAYPLHDLRARFDLPKSSLGFWRNLFAVIRRIRKICLQENAAILQSFLFWQNIITVPAGVLAPPVRAIITGRRNLGLYKDRRWHYQLLENLTNRHTDAVICNAEAVRRDARWRERISPRRLFVIHNAIRTEPFRKARPAPLREMFPALAQATFLVGTIGNLKGQKRHDLFMLAIREAHEQEPGIRGVIVGRDLGEEVKLKRLARRLGLQDIVVFAGPTDDAASCYKAFDAFLLSSDFEGLPNVVMEAMAAGCPVVTTDAGGAGELVRNESEGLLVPKGDWRAMGAAILTLARDAGLRARLAESAQSRIEQRFSPERLVEKHIRLYRKLL